MEGGKVEPFPPDGSLVVYITCYDPSHILSFEVESNTFEGVVTDDYKRIFLSRPIV